MRTDVYCDNCVKMNLQTIECDYNGILTVLPVVSVSVERMRCCYDRKHDRIGAVTAPIRDMYSHS